MGRSEYSGPTDLEMVKFEREDVKDAVTLGHMEDVTKHMGRLIFWIRKLKGRERTEGLKMKAQAIRLISAFWKRAR